VKFIIDNIWLIGLILLSGGALLWRSFETRGATLSLFEATKMINQGNAAILDVRDADQFATGHLRDAKNIPHRELADRAREIERFKSKAVIVVCNSGVQSSRVLAQLRKMGFAQVYNLAGGISAWSAQGLPTTTK
jgi:rhodanese-related sulfurtransferase